MHVGGVERVLWRSAAGYRAVAWVYAVVLFVRVQDDYAHPLGGWAVLGAMAVWTVLAPVAYAYISPRALALAVDLATAIVAIAATLAVDTHSRVVQGAQTLPVIWPAAAVLSWAIALGWRGGLPAAIVVGLASILERGRWALTTIHNAVLLVLLGTIIGYAAVLARSAQRQIAAARAAEASLAERERLGRAVHDGVLQVLALTARRGAASDDTELVALASEAERQEQALRALVSSRAPVVAAGTSDLGARLMALGTSRVSVAVPPGPVEVASAVADELAAAVAAALDNVRRHAGPAAKAWVLLEDTGHNVVVSVRDDGPGFAPDRLAEAERAGRMGVRSSIVGRLADLGGTASVESWPEGGTEVEIVLPRSAG